MSDITFKVENFNQTTGNYVIDDINNITFDNIEIL